MLTLLWLSMCNLARQRWLALVLALSVSIPLMSYLVLTAAHSELSRRYDHLSQAFLVVEQGGSMGEFYGSRLPENTAAVLRARGASLIEPEIRAVTGTIPQDMVLMRGITLETYTRTEEFSVIAGKPLMPGNEARRVMVGVHLSDDRNAPLGGEISIRGRNFIVQAIFSTGTYSDYEAWMSLADAQELLGWENEVSIFIVPAGETLRPGDVLPGGVVVAQKGESGTNLVAEFNQLFDLLRLISITLGISAAVNLANALWRLAWQQRRELAILQAIGFSRRFLFVYLGGQGFAITLTGFVLGVTEEMLMAQFSRLQTAGIALQPSLDGYTIMLCMVYAFLVFLFSTALPVAWLARLNLAGLMRTD
jgi:ABC-type lipoprotein release transport system permease subunit